MAATCTARTRVANVANAGNTRNAATGPSNGPAGHGHRLGAGQLIHCSTCLNGPQNWTPSSQTVRTPGSHIPHLSPRFYTPASISYHWSPITLPVPACCWTPNDPSISPHCWTPSNPSILSGGLPTPPGGGSGRSGGDNISENGLDNHDWEDIDPPPGFPDSSDDGSDQESDTATSTNFSYIPRDVFNERLTLAMEALVNNMAPHQSKEKLNKAHVPNTFDRSNLKKLDTFITQC
ncbi:hypothetical protein NP233_g6970 [Leucocoprinus birnbaumii]|uniref:Uncharacterized protein n=1 Tax=Leucocoprinus birnbaumii TaxID=56174 RepID=A0AAD5VR82_9AGAR|nr:hypothetical protein NP233_g6970 [Leucocoprinus birnbaumii]